MNILVIIKQTFDTEEKISIKAGRIHEDGAEFIINPYDEYAIEEAIKLRDEFGGEVTAITVGTDRTENALRTALAMGADKSILVEVDSLFGDEYTISKVLAAVIKDRSYHIILAGNMSVDSSSGQVGSRLAEELGISVVTSITKLTVEGDKAKIERDAEGDIEMVEARLPLLVTCQQGLNEPRYPSLPGIMKAKKKPLERLELDDLDMDEDDVEAKSNTIEVFLPPVKGVRKILKGDLKQQAQELISLLKTEAKVI